MLEIQGITMLFDRKRMRNWGPQGAQFRSGNY